MRSISPDTRHPELLTSIVRYAGNQVKPFGSGQNARATVARASCPPPFLHHGFMPFPPSSGFPGLLVLLLVCGPLPATPDAPKPLAAEAMVSQNKNRTDNPIDRAPSSGPDVTFHFQPEGRLFGDPIPFYHEGIHHVFYLSTTTRMDGCDFINGGNDTRHWQVVLQIIDGTRYFSS